MNKELKMFANFVQNKITVYTKNDKEILIQLKKNFKNLHEFERPDMVLPLKDKVLIIEHFEFDASKWNRKGSLDKSTASKKNKEFDDNLKSQNYNTNLAITQSKIDYEFTFENYMNNLEVVYENHLSKIEEYKDNIIKCGKYTNNRNSIITAFLIIDTTPLGNYYLDENKNPKTFNIFQIPEFLNRLENSPQVDYIFNGFYNGKENSMVFMSNTETSRNFFKEYEVNFNESNYFCFDVQETRFYSKK